MRQRYRFYPYRGKATTFSRRGRRNPTGSRRYGGKERGDERFVRYGNGRVLRCQGMGKRNGRNLRRGSRQSPVQKGRERFFAGGGHSCNQPTRGDSDSRRRFFCGKEGVEIRRKHVSRSSGGETCGGFCAGGQVRIAR